MKKLFFLLTICTATVCHAQHSLEKVWESDTTLAVPESVLAVAGKDLLYVSLIDGGPWEVDGKGHIAVLNKQGKIVNPRWATGLNAPKGMGLVGNKLYVADVTEVVVIDTRTGKTEQKIAVPGAQALNDITIGINDDVYVSDSKAGKVHRIRKGAPEEFMSGLNGLNGLLWHANELYVCTANDVLRTRDGKQTAVVATMPMGGDGIEPVGNGDLITSTWSGVVYYITKDGQVTSLLDTREQKKNTADIGYDAKNRIVYVPTFFAKSVVAYRLK